MSGLVAVIAVGNASPVRAAEASQLADDFERVRAGVRRQPVHGGDRVRVVTFQEQEERWLAVSGAGSWVAIAGQIRGPRCWSGDLRELLRSADGQFALVGYDDDADEAVVANDPMGMCALYVTQRGDRVYVSTSALALARHVRCPASQLGLRAYLVSGYHFGTRTHWDAVRRLNPASRIVYSDAGATESIYWRPTVDRRVWKLPFSQAVGHALESAQHTYRSYLDASEPSWVDLTGGFDSRLLALLLDSSGLPIAANTRDTARFADVELAERISATRAWQWYHTDLPADWPERLTTMLPTALGWGDGQLDVVQLSRVLWTHDRLAQHRRGLFSGGGGEHFQYHAWQSEFLGAGRSSKPHLDRWIDMIALKPAGVGVLTGSPVAEVRDDFRARLTAWLEPYTDELDVTQLGIAYAYKSVGHFGAYRSADPGAGLRAELPFYFTPVFNTAMSTNFRHRSGHRLMRGMINRLSPAVAAMPTTRGGPAQPWRPWRAHRFFPYYGQLGRKATAKVSAKVLGRPLLLSHGVHPWQSEANRSVLGYLSRERVLDHSRMRTASLVRPDRLADLLAAAPEPGFADDAMLGRIITAEMALRATDTALE